MADIALTENYVASDRSVVVRRFGMSDVRFRILTAAAAFLVVAIFSGVIASLVIGALPAMREFGFAFVYTKACNPVTEKFGAFASVYGTVVSSFLAMAVAVPVGIGIAIFLTEICPRPLRRPIGIAIELLAGIPSIVYGIWGLFVFAPFFQSTVQPWFIDLFVDVPILQDIFAGPP